MSAKVRSLSSYCYSLRFEKPLPMQMLPRVRFICNNERIQISDDSILSLVTSIGGDFRQVLNYLQLVSLSRSPIHSGASSLSLKDKSIGLVASEASKLMLSNSKMSLQDRYDLFFIDYEMVPLLIQQNYVSSALSNRSPGNKLEQLADAADSVCDMEMMRDTMLKTNEMIGWLFDL